MVNLDLRNTLVFILAGGDTEPSPLSYTGVTRSYDKGRTWTPLERFDVGFPREGKTIGQGPTELMILGRRATLFFSTHSKHWANDWRSWFLTSDDSFKTWSKPQEVPGRLKNRTFIRKHIVTREVAYESMPYALRAALHERVGACIETAQADAIRTSASRGRPASAGTGRLAGSRRGRRPDALPTC